MKRKEFLKTSSALVAAGFLPLAGCGTNAVEKRKNWGGNYGYQAKQLREPVTVEDVQKLVQQFADSKALGSRHCFNGIADSINNQISLRQLNRVLTINPDKLTVEVEGGIRYEELAPSLEAAGFALANLASLPQITVAGACATATHGSGLTNGNLATAVTGFEFISGTGELVSLSREANPDIFDGTVVNFGALGIITKLTLQIEKSFFVSQRVFQNMPFENLIGHIDEIMRSGYSVSVFIDWKETQISQVWIKQRTDNQLVNAENDFFGAIPAARNLHPVTRFPADACTEQMGVAGPWYARLPHFKIGALPNQGNELQSEYFVPFENAEDAIMALKKKADIIYPELLISELRTIAADDLWLSPMYKRQTLAIHFTWKNNWEGVKKILPVIEGELMPFGVRPHWGKTFTLKSQHIQPSYTKFNDFLTLVKRFDPHGKFQNEYFKTVLAT